MKISIIGAGIGGLTTAIALRKYRPDIELEIFEGSSELKAAGAGLTLAANAIAAFNQMGVKEEVLAVSNILEGFQVLDSSGCMITQTNNIAINHNLQTISNFSVHRADLQQVLLAQIPEVPVHLNKRVWDFRSDGNCEYIRFSDCSEMQQDFVIAADGIHSIFREKLLPQSKIRYAGYTCWRGVAGGGNDALNSKIASETWGLGKRFGIVPLTDGRVYWFACLNAPKAKDERFAVVGKKELLEIFRDFHAPVTEIIASTEPEKILWNDIIDFPPVEKFAFGRVLLVGDAAHATTPNMGQGACQAIEDAAVLGKLLKHNQDPQVAFIAFEKMRTKRTSFIVNRSWQIGKIAQLANPMLANIRNWAMRLVPESMNERQVRALLEVEF